jgi:bla regulator protein blaR1
METFGLYLLKSVIWLSGFALVYFIFLRNERFFKLKRCYLLSGIMISLLFPLISVHYQVDIAVPVISNANLTPSGDYIPASLKQISMGNQFDYRHILLIVYLSGVLYVTLRLIRRLRILFTTIKKAGFNKHGSAKLIRSSDYSFSFTFFNYVFINPSIDYTEAGEIMHHELVHVSQKHWVDLLIVEFLSAVQWVNPVVWIYTGFIRLNHEYLADETALLRTSDPAVYRAVLLNQMFSSPVISLTNSFNYSLNKKRFGMMKKMITSPYRKMKVLFVLPVFAIILYAFAEPEYHYTNPTESVLTIFEVAGIPGEEAKDIIVQQEVKPILEPTLQSNDVKGIVVQEDGKLLDRAVIVVKGTTLGTVTDKEGRFRLEQIPDNVMLVASYVGYKTRVLQADFTTEMRIEMERDTINLKYINDPVSSPPPPPPPPLDAALEEKGSTPTLPLSLDQEGDMVIGKDKYLKIKSNDGMTPLIIIDGVISDIEINKISPKSIEAISVLKGQSAMNKYGQKARNGAIEITTKKDMSESLLGKGSPLVLPLSLDTKGEMVIDKDKYFKIRSNDRKTPIILVDGVETDIKTTKIDPEIIKSVGVYRAGMGIEKFGEIGKDDIIEIITRNDGSKNNGVRPLCFEYTKTPPDQVDSKKPFHAVENMPEFPGGKGAMAEWIAQNLKYPAEAIEKNQEGIVRVRFVINLEGKVGEVVALRSENPVLDKEALRVISSMPDWKPGKQSGKAVDVYYMVPVEFKLKNDISVRKNLK